MSTLLLNAPAGHASRAFVDNHYLRETETFHQQAAPQKIGEQNAHYLLTIA